MTGTVGKKPVIGVIPLYDEDRESIWMVPGYLDGLRAAGAVPVILPLQAEKEEYIQLDGLLDGYLMTGGHDVSPELYGEEPKENCGAVCRERDVMETEIYRRAVEQDKPVLGICRGIQLMNVLEGGTLYQDIPTEYRASVPVEHHMCAPYDRTVHRVFLEKNCPLCQALGREELQVNSYHHQAVKEIGKNLVVMARAEDGLVEAVYRPDRRFVWGVQWHPEFIYQKDADALKIFKVFVAACKEE